MLIEREITGQFLRFVSMILNRFARCGKNR